MTGSETILNRIKADCDQKVNAIELEAEEKRKSVLAEAEEQAEKLESEIAGKTSRDLKRLESSTAGRCELERRNALLKRRRTEIDKTINGLLSFLINQDDNSYFEYIYKLCAQLKGKSGEIYNIASPYISSTALIAHHCVKLFPDRELKIITKGTPKYVSPISPTIRVLDNTKLSELGYTPKISISKGIEKTASILLEVM